MTCQAEICSIEEISSCLWSVRLVYFTIYGIVINWFSMGLLKRIRRKRRHSDAYNKLVGAFLAAYIVACLTESKTMAAKSSKKANRRAATPENETPAQAFVRLATGRTNKAVKAISLIAQLTGTAYESTDVQKRAIVTALEAATEQVKEVFAGTAKSSDSFKLPS